MNIIFFVFVGLERKVFAIPQLSPIYQFFPGKVTLIPVVLGLGQILTKTDQLNVFKIWNNWPNNVPNFAKKKGSLIFTLQNSYSINPQYDTVTTPWLDSDGVVTIVNCQQHSDYFTQLINCVFTVLLAVVKGDYTITVQSLPCRSLIE